MTEIPIAMRGRSRTECHVQQQSCRLGWGQQAKTGQTRKTDGETDLQCGQTESAGFSCAQDQQPWQIEY